MPKRSVQKTYGNKIGGAELVALKRRDPEHEPGFTHICQQKIPYFFHAKICSEQTNLQGWQYGMVRSEFAYYVPCILNLTSVPYFRSIFEAYHTNVPFQYHYKKGIPYFLAKIEAYCTVLPFLLLTTRNFN